MLLGTGTGLGVGLVRLEKTQLCIIVLPHSFAHLESLLNRARELQRDASQGYGSGADGVSGPLHVAHDALPSDEPVVQLARRLKSTVSGTFTYRPCGLMDKASDFGSEDCRFESCHGRDFFGKNTSKIQTHFRVCWVSEVIKRLLDRNTSLNSQKRILVVLYATNETH